MLTVAFIIAFIVYFVKATTWKGMIFHGLCRYLTGLPSYIRKPLYECPVCMTPWWGVLIYLVGHFVGLTEFAELTAQRVVFTVFTAGGINTLILIINKIYDTVDDIEEKTPPAQTPVSKPDGRLKKEVV